MNNEIIHIGSSVLDRYTDEPHLDVKDVYCPQFTTQAYNFAQSFFQEASFFSETRNYDAMMQSSGIVPSEFVMPSSYNNWKEGNKGLYLGIHGIDGHPKVWRNQTDTLKEQYPNFEIRLPYVTKTGNCTLDEAVDPIEAMVRDYIKKHPRQPVCLMGISNGARIALELDVRLRDTTTPIFVSSVAGAFSGTTQIDILHTFGLATKMYGNDFVNDMHYQSDSAKSLINRVRKGLPEKVERAYDFYAAPDDFAIKPYTASLPVLKEKEVNYFVVPGKNHNSILPAVSTMQVQRCMDWMQKHVVSL